MLEVGGHPHDLLESLPWDSKHFGFPVARITAADLDDAHLEAVLHRARRASARLVYWTTSSARSVGAQLLSEFSGILVDWRTTLARDLGPVPGSRPPVAVAGLKIVEYPEQSASQRLLQLGVAAGGHSRFHTDPRIPPERARAMFECWVKSCVEGTAADVVLVATSCRTGPLPLGMVTVSVQQGLGKIGLIAVHQAARGNGIGGALLREADHWMRQHGAERATLVTQRANTAACRLYERLGYATDRVRQYYHFWPLEAGET